MQIIWYLISNNILFFFNIVFICLYPGQVGSPSHGHTQRFQTDREPWLCQFPHLISNRSTCSHRESACSGTQGLVHNGHLVKHRFSKRTVTTWLCITRLIQLFPLPWTHPLSPFSFSDPLSMKHNGTVWTLVRSLASTGSNTRENMQSPHRKAQPGIDPGWRIEGSSWLFSVENCSAWMKVLEVCYQNLTLTVHSNTHIWGRYQGEAFRKLWI